MNLPRVVAAIRLGAFPCLRDTAKPATGTLPVVLGDDIAPTWCGSRPILGPPIACVVSLTAGSLVQPGPVTAYARGS
jgi:hypothetical protein